METTQLISQLLEMMATLRSPDKGCPWDKSQTFHSIVPHTIEEAYEVADAIENGTPDMIRDELGDLLFQIIFYCQMASEKKWWAFNDVAQGLIQKLMHRHPHVFGEEKYSSIEEHRKAWEKFKANERALKKEFQPASEKATPESVLSGIAATLPALSRAHKLQIRAAMVGFDWERDEDIVMKIHEECEEFLEAKRENNPDKIAEELGDLLFACTNLVRFNQHSSEQLLRAANQKFTKRFTALEGIVQKSNKSFDEYTIDELEAIWQEVKKEKE